MPLLSYHPLPGCEHIGAGGPGRARWCSFALLLLRGAAGHGRRSHTPSSAINQVRISLISYGGEQPGKASTPAKKIWTRRHLTWPLGFGEEASLLFQRHFHYYSSPFRLPSARGSEVCCWVFRFFQANLALSLGGQSGHLLCGCCLLHCCLVSWQSLRSTEVLQLL